MRVTPTVELRSVQKRFGATIAVRDMALSIPPGSTYGLLGPNGAGKTTTIRMILDILQPDAGEIRLFGAPFTRAALDRVGYLPEERGLYRRMTVRRLLAFFADLKGVPSTVSAPRIQAWLERLDLADRADARVQELSKGNQQKLQFIAAVLHDPQLVILDEPFSGLDPLNQQVLKEIILELRARERTILFSTHIIEHAERICDHVCIIARGAKVVDGPIGEVRQAHGGSYVRLGLEGRNPELRERLRRSPAIATVRDLGNDLELQLRDGADPHALLADLVAAGVRVRRFEHVEPSLEQIFIERVGATAATTPEVARV
jgi:ABC-2 type transport system ATP-binding protein